MSLNNEKRIVEVSTKTKNKKSQGIFIFNIKENTKHGNRFYRFSVNKTQIIKAFSEKFDMVVIPKELVTRTYGIINEMVGYIAANTNRKVYMKRINNKKRDKNG